MNNNFAWLDVARIRAVLSPFALLPFPLSAILPLFPLLATLSCLFLTSPTAAQEVTIGTDSEGNYIIDSQAKLNQLALNVANGTTYLGETILLANDIELPTVTYPNTNHSPIGLYDAQDYNRRPFLGTFDGQGHKITNLQVNSYHYVAGLFGYIGAGGIVKDLTISSIEVRVDKGDGDYSTCYVGSIAGFNAGTIVGCANRGVTVYGNVSYALVGGIAGENTGSIQNCYNLGRVYTSSSSGNLLGGIVAENASSGTIKNCFVRASIDDGNQATDGPICANNQAPTANISGCFYMNGSSTDNYVNLSLSNTATNDLSSYNTQTKNVLLKDRTIYSDGAWNTLCLPFGIPASGNGRSPIAGATVKELDTEETYNGHKTGFDQSTGTLYLYFKDVTSITAGKPYIVKWDEAIASDLSNPVFLGVTVNSADPTAVNADDETVSFIGSYSPIPLSANDKSSLFLGAANKLYYPNAAMNIGSCRAYFKLNGNFSVKSCNLNFGDSETAIKEIVNSKSLNSKSLGAWYSLDGRRLSGKPTTSGLYIKQGRKVAVK